MGIESAMVYAVAVALPVWLVVEHFVHRARSQEATAPRRVKASNAPRPVFRATA